MKNLLAEFQKHLPCIAGVNMYVNIHSGLLGYFVVDRTRPCERVIIVQ